MVEMDGVDGKCEKMSERTLDFLAPNEESGHEVSWESGSERVGIVSGEGKEVARCSHSEEVLRESVGRDFGDW